MEYILSENDLEPQDIAEMAVTGGREIVAQRLNVSAQRLNRLIASSPEATDLIRAAVAEYEELARLRLALVTGSAIDALERVVLGVETGREAMAMVRGAEAIMDRGFLPKQPKVNQTDIVRRRITELPTLDELVERAETPEQALDLVERHKNVMAEVEALRRGAKEIIDGEVRPKVQS